jgi:hypothetical protein
LGAVVVGLIAAGWAAYNYYQNVPSDLLYQLIDTNYRLSEIAGVRYNDPLERMAEARLISIIVGIVGGFIAALGGVLTISGIRK